MVTFRNNNRRSSFRGSNNRRSSFRNNNEGSKFSHNDNFQRRSPGRNNHNAVKLIEKYNDLAREALASGDKILSESYFQHADHFTRIQKEQENARVARVNSASVTAVKSVEAKNEDQLIKETSLEQEDKKVTKTIDKKTEEKETAVS